MTHKGWYSPEDIEVLKRHGELALAARAAKIDPIADKAEAAELACPTGRFTSFYEGMPPWRSAEIVNALNREAAD